jgi:hypothetical protein
MKSYFRIETKQTEFLKGTELESLQIVLDNICLFDLIPPFKVLNEKNEDVTVIVMNYAKENNYNFVDRKKVGKLIPSRLKKIMNKYYKKNVSLSLIKNMTVKLIPVEDIKSIEGFYEIWDHKGITIGTSNDIKIFIDTSDEKCSVYCIKECYLNDFSKKELLSASANIFVDTFTKAAEL